MTPRCWAGEAEWMVGPLSDLSLCLFLSDTSGAGLIAKSCPTLVTLLHVPSVHGVFMENGDESRVGECVYLSFRLRGDVRQEYWSGLPFPSPQIQVVLSNVALLFSMHRI